MELTQTSVTYLPLPAIRHCLQRFRMCCSTGISMVPIWKLKSWCFEVIWGLQESNHNSSAEVMITKKGQHALPKVIYGGDMGTGKAVWRAFLCGNVLTPYSPHLFQCCQGGGGELIFSFLLCAPWGRKPSYSSSSCSVFHTVMLRC